MFLKHSSKQALLRDAAEFSGYVTRLRTHEVEILESCFALPVEHNEVYSGTKNERRRIFDMLMQACIHGIYVELTVCPAPGSGSADESGAKTPPVRPVVLEVTLVLDKPRLTQTDDWRELK